MLESISMFPQHVHWWPEVDQLFREISPELGTSASCSDCTPALNVWEDAESFQLEAELPGAKLEDIEVSVLGNELWIKGSRKIEERTDATYHRKERTFGRFERAIHLPAEVKPDSIQATLKDGILTVSLPKAEVAKPRLIEVKVK